MVNLKIFKLIFMANLISHAISESEQMYLITIARSMETGGPALLPLSHIAKELSLQPVSVNQMVRKLESEGLVHYHPYKGVELTDKGQNIAFRTLRNRRLWQVFLVEQLGVSLQEADAMACNLEHFTPDDIAKRLSSLLDDPVIGPGGHPIPSFDENQVKPIKISLAGLGVGMRAQVIEVNAHASVNHFLSTEGVRPGSEIKLLAVGEQGTRLLAVDQGYVEVTEEIAASIQLLPINITR